MQTQRLISHYAYLKSSHSDEFEQWIMSRLHISDDYFNDIIGTKLMRQCKFDEAAAYLEKVPVTYLDKQNIAPFMASRSYTVERWFKHQKMAEDYTTAEVRLTSNPKLRFCREMSQMESEYTYLSDANTRQAKAYELAVRYLQASYLGDCWYLTRYAQSCMDSCRVNETDYAAKAVNYLSLSKLSSDFSMKEKSIYALAYIPLDPWGGYFDDYEKKYNTENINTASRQYHSLIELALFTKSNDVDNYVSHCDVLNHFLKMANK
jgi:hypothetical protein